MATARFRSLPDFIIIGAQKCGTSSMYQYLIQHPDVASAQKKEVHFFGWEYARGEAWYRAHFPMRAYRGARRLVSRPLVTGEATPYYLFHPHVPGRVRALLPEVRLIVLLRNPVDRAISAYHHQVRQGREQLSLQEALSREQERLEGEMMQLARQPLYNSDLHRHYSYLARGIYADQLAAWFEVFPREQFLILRSEDFFRDTASAFAETLAFLGLPAWRPATFRRFNAGRKQTPAPGADDASREYLQDFYGPHNRRLSELLGRDFGWGSV